MLNKRTLFPVALLAALVLLALAALLPGTIAGRASQIEALPFDGRVQIIAVPGDGTTRYVPPPASALRAPATADIQVAYGPGFPTEARQAFEYAVQIWESSINSSVPIIVDARWVPLGTNVLGAAGPSNVYRDFLGAPLPSTWYPSALADKLYGLDIAGSDIEATFNSAFTAWYFGTDGNPPADRLDFTSVVLHELGHGLGFLGYANVSSGSANMGYLGYPFVYDRYTETGSGVSLLALSPTQLYDALTGGNVFFDGPGARASNSGQPVKLYAPNTWMQGSSYSHVDDIFDGTANALMTWSLSGGEAIHHPGPVALSMLSDTGWGVADDPPTATPTRTPTITPLASPASVGYVPQALYDASKDNITPPPSPTSTATATSTSPPPTPHGGAISGTVTEGGAPASGVELWLRRYNPLLDDWFTIDTVLSAADGSFSFDSPPPLAADEVYNVTYNNQTLVIGRLWVWQTRHLESYSAGEVVQLGQFDIADVNLLSPAPQAAVTPPVEFTWQTRPATPSDSYAFQLYDDNDPVVAEFISEALGYVGAYTLSGLPTGFTTGVEYNWDVYIFTPDYDPANPFGTGWGWSLQYRRVEFLSSSLQVETFNGPATQLELPIPAGNPVDRIEKP